MAVISTNPINSLGAPVYSAGSTPDQPGPGTVIPGSLVNTLVSANTPPNVKIHTTGPVFHFIELPSGTKSTGNEASANASAIYFLGTSEFAPRIRFNDYWTSIRFNQFYGSRLPGEQSFDGKSAQIYTELNIYSEKVLQILEAAPRQGFSTKAMSGGRYAAGDVGAMFIGDRCYFGLHLIFSSASKMATFPLPAGYQDTAFNGGFTPVGYRFMYCKVLTQYSTGGSGQELKRMMIFDAMAARRQQMYYDPPFGAGPPPVNHYFELYDHKVLSADQLQAQVIWNTNNDTTINAAMTRSGNRVPTPAVNFNPQAAPFGTNLTVNAPANAFSPPLQGTQPPYNPYG